MPVRIPMFYDFSNINFSTIRIRTTTTLGPWKIGVLRKKDLYWCIVLSFLKSTTNWDVVDQLFQDCKSSELSASMQKLDFESIKSYVENYNPFLNRNDCFHKPELRFLVHIFQWGICRYIDDKENQTNFPNDGWRLQNSKSILQAASLILHSKIYVIHEETNDKDHSILSKDSMIDVYPTMDIRGSSSWGTELTLYYKKSSDFEFSTFNFGLLKKNGDDLQERAFIKIFQEIIHCKQKVLDLLRIDGVKTNFVVALIKNDSLDKIKLLYQSSPHILHKLSDAGFVVDPSCKESCDERDLNAFYYVLCSDDTEALHLLYKYATKCSQNIDSSPRYPDSTIIDGLKQLSQILLKTRDTYKKMMLKTHIRLEHIDELIGQHDFLLKVCDQLFKIRNKINYFDNIPEVEFKAERQQQVVLTVLDAYCERICTDVFTEEENTPKLTFERYMKYVIYYQHLDVMAALFFFDHSFSLKQKLLLDDGCYERIESAFVRSIVVSKYNFLEKTVKRNKNKIRNFFPLLEYLSRNSFEVCVNEFREHVRGISIKKENIKDDLEELDIYYLKTEPVIKDDVYLSRMIHYIDMVLHLDIDKNDNSVFAIQRAYQVLGESVKPEIDEPVTLVKALVISSMPEEILIILRKIRNKLCFKKIYSKFIESRFKLEEDKEFFKKLQGILRIVKSSLDHIFEFQKLWVQSYICQNRLKAIENCDQETKKGTKDKFNECENELKKDQKLIKQDIKKLLIKNINIFENHFQRHLDFIEIIDEEKPNLDQIQHRLECLKLLLRFFAECTEIGRSTHKFVNQIEILNTKISSGDDADIIRKRGQEFKKLKSKILQDMKLPKAALHEEMPNFDEKKNIILIFLDCLMYPSNVLPEKRQREEEEEEEKRNVKKLLDSVPKKYIIRHESLSAILKSLQEGEKLSLSDLDIHLKNLDINKDKHTRFRDIYQSENVCHAHRILKKEVSDILGTLKQNLEENSMEECFYNRIRKRFNFPNDTEKFLEKIILWKNRPDEKVLDFLHKRLIIIRKIIIENHSRIQYMWKTVKSLKTKRYIQDQIVQLYIQQPDLQAAVELLFFDCMVMLKKDSTTNLEYIWHKTDRLFNGINMRNMLAHGNPLFEVIASHLDPEDLPNEIIGKVLELIADIEPIDAICRLREESMRDPAEIIEMVDTNCKGYEKYNEVIRKCCKWREYVLLILPKKKSSCMPKAKKVTAV